MSDLTAGDKLGRMTHELTKEFWTSALHNLHLEYIEGAVAPLPPSHTSGWRSLPWLVTAQLEGPALLYFTEKRFLQLNAGEAICIAPGVMHSCDNMASISNVSRWSHLSCLVFHTVQIGQFVEFPPIVRGEAAVRLGAINEALARAETQAGSEAALRQATLLLELLATCLSVAKPTANGGMLADLMRLLPVLRYIDDHLHLPLKREELASRAHLSPSRFGAVFGAALGMSPGLYVQNLQIQRAQALLLNTDLSVSEIAEQCGQKDAFHFSRMFKQHSGTSPAYYRSRVRQGLI